MSPIVPINNESPEDYDDADANIFSDDLPNINNQFNLALGLSDSEGENNEDENVVNAQMNAPYAYEPLFQDPVDTESNGETHSDADLNSEDSVDVNPHFTVAEFLPSVATDTCQGTQSRDCPPMDEEHIEKIKAAMCGFSLPRDSIPTWAADVPEAVWKARLISSITNHSNTFPDISSK